MTRSSIQRLIPAILAILALPAVAWAQTGPGLLISPWTTQAHLELDQSLLFIAESQAEVGGIDESIQIYSTDARLRLDNQAEHSLVFGFEQDLLDGDQLFTNESNVLIQRLAVGVPINEWDGWQVGLIAGLGFAGDEPYDDSDAWFGVGSLIAAKQLDEASSLTLLLNYDGNRSIFPDVPLPGIIYQRRVDETFTYSVGFPFLGVTWKPIDRLTIDARYAPPYSGQVTATYRLLDELRLFGEYGGDTWAYHQSTQRDDDRTFYSHQRLEGGLRWVPCEFAELAVSGGWAFDQQVSRGFDVRGDHDTVDLSDEPFVRIAFDLRF